MTELSGACKLSPEWTVKLAIGYVSRNHVMTYKNLTFRARHAALLAAAFLCGCASAAAKPKADAGVKASPLSGMIGRQMVVFPGQYLALAGPAGTWDITQEGRTLLPILDEEIADAMRKRGANNNWTFGSDITARADRNGGLAGDPRQLSVQAIRRTPAGDTPLPEPLAGQIRTLVSLTNARYALLPIETHVDNRNGERKGSLRLLMVDARTARIVWVDDITAPVVRDPAAASEALTPFGFRQFARGVANAVADLVVAQ